MVIIEGEPELEPIDPDEDWTRTRAVADLLRARPQISDLEALLTLKAGCDRTLAEKAGAGGVKNAANTAVPRAK